MPDLSTCGGLLLADDEIGCTWDPGNGADDEGCLEVSAFRVEHPDGPGAAEPVESCTAHLAAAVGSMSYDFGTGTLTSPGVIVTARLAKKDEDAASDDAERVIVPGPANGAALPGRAVSDAQR